MPAKDATAGSGFAAARAQLSKAVSSSKGENASAKRTFDDDLSDPSLEVIPRSTENRTLRLAFSPDSKVLAVGGFESVVTLWSVKSWKLLRTLR